MPITIYERQDTIYDDKDQVQKLPTHFETLSNTYSLSSIHIKS